MNDRFHFQDGEKMKKKVQPKMVYVILFLLTVFLVYGWRLGTGRVIHSDELSVIFAGQDMFSGDPFLKGWHLTTGVFLLPTIELACAVYTFGYSETLVYMVAGINYALMVFSGVWIVFLYARKWTVKKAYVYSIVVFLILLIPRSVTLLNAGTHVLSYAAAILAIFFTYYLSGIVTGVWVKAGWTFVLGLLSVTNSMFLYTACIPILLVGIVVSYENKKKHRLSGLLYYGVSSVILYAVFQKLWIGIRGEKLGAIDTVFASREDIWNQVVMGTCNILEIFGINFWEEKVFSVSTCRAGVGFVILLKLAYEIVQYIKQKEKRDREIVYLFLAVAAVNITAYVFSTVPAYSPDVNLIQPFLLGFTLAGILAWMHNEKEKKEKEEIKCNIVVVCSFLLFLLMFPAFTVRQPDNMGRRQAAEYLKDHGYQKGFASYWDAASVMYASKGELEIEPVICHNIVEVTEDTKLVAYRWMTKKEWEQQEGNFLIVDPESDMQYAINENTILQTFGQYEEKKQFGDITVYLWNENKKLQGY